MSGDEKRGQKVVGLSRVLAADRVTLRTVSGRAWLGRLSGKGAGNGVADDGGDRQASRAKRFHRGGAVETPSEIRGPLVSITGPLVGPGLRGRRPVELCIKGPDGARRPALLFREGPAQTNLDLTRLMEGGPAPVISKAFASRATDGAVIAIRDLENRERRRQGPSPPLFLVTNGGGSRGRATLTGGIKGAQITCTAGGGLPRYQKHGSGVQTLRWANK